MLTPDQITALRDRAGQVTDPIVEYLIADIAERVSEAGQLTSTAAYQAWTAQKFGVSQKDLKKELKKRLNLTTKEIDQLFEQAAQTGYANDLKRLGETGAVSFDENTSLQQILDSSVKLANADFENITQSMGFIGPDGQFDELTKAYQRSCDFAFEKVVTGAQDYNSAVRDAINGLAKHGIRVMDYDSGVHTSLEAAVRRNIMGGLGLMNEQITQQNHDDLGCDGWEISAHGGSAPDHEPYQGKQYSDKEYERLNNSLVRRIGTLNCGHSAMPIILGVNEPQYTKAELEEFRQQNEDGVTYEGKHYTLYEATQRQRKLESSIRNRKRRILIDEKLGDKDALQTDQIRLQILKQEYSRFSKAANLPMQHARMEAAGFDWKKGKAAENAAKESKKISLANHKKGATITVGENNMTISSIDSPIEQRHTGKGKPGAILHYDVDLTNRQTTLLDSLPAYDSRVVIKKSDVSMADLAALTAKTGDEFALFTREGERLVIRGSTSKVNIDVQEAIKLAEEGYTWSGHTHPGVDINCLVASQGDIEILKCFKQERSCIYNSLGEYLEFWKE